MITNALHIWLYMHEDLSDINLLDFEKDYLSHLKEELHSICDFEIRFIIQSTHTPGVSDLDYKIGNEAALEQLVEGLRTVPRSESGLDKFLLVTRENLQFANPGIAQIGGHAGIASITVYQAIAHELGHMLGTEHEDADTYYDGWWKESYTTAERNPLRGNAYRYSDRNRDNIKRYLDGWAASR